MINSGREWDWMYNLIKNEKEMDENEEPIYRYGIEDLMLTKTEHTKERSKYITLTDSNGDVLGEVEPWCGTARRRASRVPRLNAVTATANAAHGGAPDAVTGQNTQMYADYWSRGTPTHPLNSICVDLRNLRA